MAKTRTSRSYKRSGRSAWPPQAARKSATGVHQASPSAAWRAASRRSASPAEAGGRAPGAAART
eukprot:1139158-Lingulodinium_polyedra.AAC.1